MKKELFDDLMQSLNEAAEHAQGKRKLRTTIVPFPPKEMSKNEIAKIRKTLNCSQGIFASALNVSVRTVQAWEQGQRKPDGASLKLLDIAKRDPQVLFKLA
ncbi:MAG: helix-turn-helix domain-containing protein [Blastocatellia bacterium]|nr:helix-turn-helix domain-containing protein [Blastocatellia bacterium]